MSDNDNQPQVDNGREEADAVEEIVEEEPPKAPPETAEVDAAEEIAEREADEYEEQDTKSGDDPPEI